MDTSNRSDRSDRDAVRKSFQNQIAEYDLVHKYIGVRKWKVREDGALCRYIFSKPDHQIDCLTISKADDKEGLYFIKWIGAGGYPFELVEGIPESLAQVLVEQAGPLD